jgi:glycerophosphoryl diester phosphodiesterase
MNSQQASDSPLSWRRAVAALTRAGKPLLIYELGASLLMGLVLGPLVLSLSYRLIELSGEAVLGNTELARFLISPLGLLSVVVILGATLGLRLMEYAGLILLADAALRGTTLSLRSAVAAILAAAPRLAKLALLLTTVALLVAVPFLALAALFYWLLLSGTDINFYLDTRPPRFWFAVALGAILAAGLSAAWLWIFLRWAFCVPATVLDRLSWRAALSRSAQWVRGRRVRLLLLLIVWWTLFQLGFGLLLAGLDQLNDLLLSRFETHLYLLIASTVALLLFDAVVLQLFSAVMTILLASLIAYEYERARLEHPDVARSTPLLNDLDPASPIPWRPAWTVTLACLLLGPLLSLGYALGIAREFIRPHTTLVTAHRAGSKLAPENSLLALERSIAAGADYVEIDVQLTADGKVVLLHDRDLRRVTGDPRVLMELSWADLADLRLLDADGPTDLHIPTLAEFFQATGDHLRVNVELKDFGPTPGLAKTVTDVIHQQDFTDRAVVTSFHLPLLLEIKAASPGTPIGMILSAIQGDMTRLPVDFLSLNHRLVNGPLVRRAHSQQKQVHVWGANDREIALRMLDLGCDNLIVSNPLATRELVDWYQSRSDAERIILRLRRWLRD